MRRGLTLTEILAATFVLSFGLVAALTVLPFATHLLSRMDVADTSGACGRGALRQIRMAEWQKPEVLDFNWNGYVPADPYIVDPLGIIAMTPVTSVNVTTEQEFPYTGVGTLLAFNHWDIALQGIPENGTDPAREEAATKLRDAANLHFRWNDDMIFAEDGKSTRPALIHPADPTKQAAGDYTWMYMVTPRMDPQANDISRSRLSIPVAVTDNPNDVLSYEVAAVVFHRRDLMPDSVRRINLANATINAAGAYIELQSGDASAPGDPDELDLSTIKWLLLTGEPDTPDRPRIAQWYRITGYDDIQGSGIYTRRVFLVGPDWKGQKNTNGDLIPGTVYAVLCDGVVNVFQATMPK